MANEQYVFISEKAIPSRQEWQESIDALGYDFQLDSELKPKEDSGYSPCKLEGKETGVEIYYQAVAELVDDPSEIEELTKGRDYCISFRWGGSMAECTCAIIASAALLKNFDGVVSYEFEAPSDLEALIKDLDFTIPEARKELSPKKPNLGKNAVSSSSSEPKPKSRLWWKFWK
ncbi:hypothetical protein [Puniceicoccus vermicola]|uniref:Uncharacterized protein n=1 Tax=Puniceicoccus vermicola TaxID=388746 RepID=A0A7X1AV71_9BACT|nr:hypothetical protein [Puniceicoccus vermicola]MBC2600479.1 hypothetical protein [Puniceicoccus vermicola]